MLTRGIDDGNPLLYRAILGDHTAIVRYPRRLRGADVNARDVEGKHSPPDSGLAGQCCNCGVSSSPPTHSSCEAVNDCHASEARASVERQLFEAARNSGPELIEGLWTW